MKKILKDFNEVINKSKNGEPIFIGKYTSFNKEIENCDIILHTTNGFIQRGVEREGCDFHINSNDIKYVIDDTIAILSNGENLKGGNCAFVFFEYKEMELVMKKEVLAELREICKLDPHGLTPHSLYTNIYNSSGTYEALSNIFEVSPLIVMAIKES